MTTNMTMRKKKVVRRKQLMKNQKLLKSSMMLTVWMKLKKWTHSVLMGKRMMCQKRRSMKTATMTTVTTT
jgi:hypothetical protein